LSHPARSGADPGHLWLGKAHRAILDTLGRAFRDGNGIAVLTGDAGTGKTSLAQRFIAMLGPAGIAVGRVSSPGQAPSDFFEAVLSAYGVRRPVHDKDAFGACIRNVLARAAARGDRMLLALDEAQGLGHELLREVGDLSALAAASGHPLFILLIGETRLTAALKDDQHAALRAHIIACAPSPAQSPEAGAYVRHSPAAPPAANLQRGGHPDDRLALPGRAGRHQYHRRSRAPGRPRAAGATDQRGHRE
jgi:type II secretory pathway predicted ATPase ExeA